jgi:hypothetical protein
MEEEKLYTLYAWIADDEGGYGVCKREEFSPNLDYRPQSGWRASPSQRVGDFNTLEELTDLILKSEPMYSKELAAEDAKWLMDTLRARMERGG